MPGKKIMTVRKRGRPKKNLIQNNEASSLRSINQSNEATKQRSNEASNQKKLDEESSQEFFIL